MRQPAASEASADVCLRLMTAAAEGPPADVQLHSPVSVSEGSSQSNDVISTPGMPTQALDLSLSSTSRTTSLALDLVEEPFLGAEASSNPRIPVIHQESATSLGTSDELCIGPSCGILQGFKMFKFLFSREPLNPNVSANK